MDVRRAYCSAVDRNVPVVLKQGASTPAQLTVQSPATLVCLDYPARCTGWCCPLHAADEAREEEDVDLSPAAPAAADSPHPPNRPKRWSRPT